MDDNDVYHYIVNPWLFCSKTTFRMVRYYYWNNYNVDEWKRRIRCLHDIRIKNKGINYDIKNEYEWEREREWGRIRNCCIILSGEFALSHISNKLQLLPTHLVTLIHLKFHNIFTVLIMNYHISKNKCESFL